MLFSDCPYRYFDAPRICSCDDRRCYPVPLYCYSMLALWRTFAKGDYSVVKKIDFKIRLQKVGVTMQFPDCPYRNQDKLGKCELTNHRCSQEPFRCYSMLSLWRSFANGDYSFVNKNRFKFHLAATKKWIP